MVEIDRGREHTHLNVMNRHKIKFEKLWQQKNFKDQSGCSKHYIQNGLLKPGTPRYN